MAETRGIETRVFHLEIITPLFLGGADGETPELRAPSFKGCMRYWWRAAVAEGDINKLARREAELFGSSAEGVGKSPLIIKTPAPYDLKAVNERPLPHSSRGFTFSGLEHGQGFKLSIHARKNLDLYSDMLELALILGGLGKRSRRGFGSVGVKGWDFSSRTSLIEYIHQKLVAVTKKEAEFEIKDDKEREKVIVRHKPPQEGGKEYPWIEEIFIGKKKGGWQDLVSTIGKATHDFKDPSLGNANPRMASPIYVSVIKMGDGYAPVVTTLKASFPKGYPNWKMDKQNSFRGAL